MRTPIAALCALTLLAPALARAGEPCRKYQLVDHDSGERVQGCVTTSVEVTGGKPIAVVPALQDRQRFGWKIAELSRADLLARMGLRPGDVLLSLNGYDLAAQESPNVIAEVLGGYDELVVAIGSKPRATPPPAATGTTVMEVTRSASGIQLSSIPANSFFATIGLLPGDTIVKIAGQPVTDLETLSRLEKQAASMDEVHVIVKRDGKELDLLVKAQ